MDFNALQRKLFELDPSDPAEDLRKLKESAGAIDNVAPTKDYVVESVQVAQGSMPVEGNYSIADFAALAGITLTEAQKTGSAGQLKGKDAIKKQPAGTTKNPTRDKLVGEDIVEFGDPNYNRSATIDKGIDKIKQLTDPNYNKFGTAKKTSVGDKLAKPGTPTQKESNLLDPKLTSKLLPYEEQLKAVFNSAKLRVKFEEFLNLYAPQAKKTAEAAKPKPIKARDPSAQYMNDLRKSGAMGAHKDKKRDAKMGKEKHKGKEYTTESIKEMLYRKLNESK
jgi:hypothetical protein